DRKYNLIFTVLAQNRLTRSVTAVRYFPLFNFFFYIICFFGIVGFKFNAHCFMLDVAVSSVSDSYSILKAPGLSDEIGGPYALLPRSELEATRQAFNKVATQVGIWALEAERIAMGRARIGLDSDHKSIPNELGLLNRAVHMAKGCYRGQETVAKVFNLGHPPRRLVLLHLDGSSVDIPNSKDPITLDGKVIGYIGSVARHHELGPIGLGVIKRMTPADAILDINGISASQEILVAIE
ncbi:MAG: hypothetical protein RIS32_518, partial [Actinomycetota bacterium]